MPFVLCATGLLTLVFIGCKRDSASSEKPVAPVAARPVDPAYTEQLCAQVKERNGLLKVRAAVVEKISVLLEAKKKELKTDDSAKAEAALRDDPEWQSLQARLKDAEQAIEDNQAHVAAAIRAHKRAEKKVSK